MVLISKERILKYLVYDKENGQFFFRQDHRSNKVRGKLAGCLQREEYFAIGIEYRKYFVHRLVWIIEKNTNPEMIDHINGNKLDNRIENLRASDQRRNQQNQYRHRDGKLVGTSFRKSTGMWRSLIKINRKSKELGSFKTAELAHQRYLQEIKRLNL